MISLLLWLLIFLIFLTILWMILEKIGPKLGLPPDIVRIGFAIIGLALLIVLLQRLGVLTGVGL